MALGGFLLLSAFVYRGSWNDGLYNDDYHWLLVARTIFQSPASLFQVDTINPEVAIRLTQRIIMGLTWALFGLRPAAYHLVSIALHAIASTAVFAVLLELHGRVDRRVGRSAVAFAAIGGILFASSSSHSMAVLWIAAQSGVLATIAVMGLLLFLLRRQDTLLERRTMIEGVLLLLLALYSKNTVAAVPLILLAFALLAPLGEMTPAQRRSWLVVSALAAAVSILHLVFTKLILFGGSMPGMQRHAAISLNVIKNLCGALLAPFISAQSYESLTSGALPYPVGALLLVAIILLVAWKLDVFRPVLWGFVWIVVSALPVSFMNYQQYDPVHLTVDRYWYEAGVGAVIILTFLLRGLSAKAARPGWVWALSALLVIGHLSYHEGRVQRDRKVLQGADQSIGTLISNVLRIAHANIKPGSVICVVGWPMEDAFVRCAGALYVEPEGYVFRSEDQLASTIEAYRRGELVEPWVAVYDQEHGGRYGTYPMAAYLRANGRIGS
jgi:hypothetical protein